MLGVSLCTYQRPKRGKNILQMFRDRDGTGIKTTETRMGSFHHPHVLPAIPISLRSRERIRHTFV